MERSGPPQEADITGTRLPYGLNRSSHVRSWLLTTQFPEAGISEEIISLMVTLRGFKEGERGGRERDRRGVTEKRECGERGGGFWRGEKGEREEGVLTQFPEAGI